MGSISGTINVHQLQDERIVIATYEGCISVEDVRQSDLMTAPLLQSFGAEAVLIIDTIAADTNFAHVFQILRQQPEMGAQHSSHFEVKVMLVGTHALAKLYVDAARQKQFGGTQIPLFACLDDAIEAARQFLALVKTPDRLVS